MLVIAADYLHMMNIYDTLDKDRSKDTVFLLLDYIGTDMQRVDELMEIALSDDARMAFRGSWVLAHLADSGVVGMDQYIAPSFEALVNPVHPAVERGLLKMYYAADSWPEELYTAIVDHMMNLIIDTKSKIAAQALAMIALHKHLQPYPELLEELCLVLEEGIPYGSAGYKAKARHIIKSIRKGR